MRTIAVVNQKGGCGKTTTAINLSGVFAVRGFRTLLVDMDPQGHCAAGLAIPEQRVDLTIGDAMLAPEDAPVDPARLLWRVMRNLDLAPATLRLAALEASRGELAGRPDAESRLRSVLARFQTQYDVCLIDCSPAIGLLAFNALLAADEVLIPVETGFFSLQGATKQINAIKSLGKRLGVAPVHRLLATMHDPQSALSQDLLEELRRRFGARVLPTVIRFDHALREAASFGQPVVEYAPDSTGAADYTALADHLVEHVIKNATPPGDVGPQANGSAQAGNGHRITIGPASKQTAHHPALGDGIDVDTTRHVPVLPERTEAVTGGVVTRQLDLVMRARRLHQSPVPLPSGSAQHATLQTQRLSDGLSQGPTPALAELKPFDLSPPADLFASGPMIARTPQTSAPAQDSTRPAFGVTQTRDGLHFCQPATIGSLVSVAGDFNGWLADRTPLKLNPATGLLEAILACPPGAYQYRLVVDGAWTPDPFNPVTLPNPFGGINSVAVVALSTSLSGTSTGRRA